MGRTRLGAIDHAWLRMERPENPMMVTGVLTFDEPVDLSRLRRRIAHAAVRFPRFAQRVHRRPLGRAEWVADPDFRVENHVLRHVLRDGTRASVLREVGRLLSTPLPRDRPLWRVDLLESPSDGHTVMVVRLHHCIGDGFALLHVLTSLTEPVPDAVDRTGSPRRAAARPSIPRLVARLARSAITDLVRLATLHDEPKTRLRGRLGSEKRAAWSTSMPLADVKAIGRGFGGTVNDVMTCAVAGAFGRYLRERGEASTPALRVAVPVNLRRGAPTAELGNYFGLVFLELPLAADPRARFAEIARRMDQLKRSPEPFVLLAAMRIVGAAPRPLQHAVVRVLSTKITAVLTNVPGPREPRSLAGHRITGMSFWVPAAGRVGIGISIFSYAGAVRVGVSADARLLPDPEHVVDEIPRELARMRTALEATNAAQSVATT